MVSSPGGILTAVALFSEHNPADPAAANASLRAFVGDGPGHIVAALHAAGVLPPGSPVPGQLAGLCARLGITGHGITAPPAGDLPDRWQSMLTSPSREPKAPPAPGILAATVAELPELDGAKITIAGLHHGERGTIMHLLATGVALEGDWPYAKHWRNPRRQRSQKGPAWPGPACGHSTPARPIHENRPGKAGYAQAGPKSPADGPIRPSPSWQIEAAWSTGLPSSPLGGIRGR